MTDSDEPKENQYLTQKKLWKEKQRKAAKERREEFKASEKGQELAERQRQYRREAYQKAKARKAEYEKTKVQPPSIEDNGEREDLDPAETDICEVRSSATKIDSTTQESAPTKGTPKQQGHLRLIYSAEDSSQ